MRTFNLILFLSPRKTSYCIMFSLISYNEEMNNLFPFFFLKVLWNPFDDIVPRQLKEKAQTHAKVAAEDQEQKKKAVKYVVSCFNF